MTRRSLVLPPDVRAELTRLLGDKTPTAARITTLLDELRRRREEGEMDQEDRDQGRRAYSARAVVDASEDPETAGRALRNAEEADHRRAQEAHEQYLERRQQQRVRAETLPPPPPDDEEEETGDEPAPPPPDDEDAPPPVTSPPPAAADADEGAEIERLKTAGVAKVYAAHEALERRSLQRLPALRAAGGRLQTLEDAAAALVAELQPNHQDAIRQVSADLTLPAWVIILGAVARLADHQELNSGDFESDWLNRGPAAPKTIARTELRCAVCDGVLPADARRGQRFCCSNHGSQKLPHSDGCPLGARQLVAGRWVTVAA